jgi:GTP-binding protein HflX
LVGYTNAGKSTLFNRLTGATVLAKSALFATLDPTLRRIRLPRGRPAILSDTVGFISDLPHELVEAFRATLDEVREADIILHVRDISASQSAAEAADVETVLEELGLGPDSGRRLVEVWNKSDRVAAEDKAELVARARRAGAVLISALTGAGVEALLERLAALVDDSPEVTVRLAASDGEALAWLYRHGRVNSREDTAEGGAVIKARLDPQALGRFQRLRPDVVFSMAAE